MSSFLILNQSLACAAHVGSVQRRASRLPGEHADRGGFRGGGNQGKGVGLEALQVLLVAVICFRTAKRQLCPQDRTLSKQFRVKLRETPGAVAALPRARRGGRRTRKPEKSRAVAAYSCVHLLLQPQLSLLRLFDLLLQAHFLSLTLPHLDRPGTIKSSPPPRKNKHKTRGGER